MKKFLLLLSILFIVSCSSSSEELTLTIKYSLTTSANPTAGGTITPASGQHNEGTTVSITATPAGEYLFSSWSGATGSTATTSVVMNSNKSVTANFVKKKYALTTSVEGEGTISEKVIKAGAATDYNSGTVVELTATPKAGWKFKEWTGDLTGNDNPKQITIDKAKSVNAVFEKLSPFYYSENGCTIKAYSWTKVGDTFKIDGATYTIVDRELLDSMMRSDSDGDGTMDVMDTEGALDLSKLVTTKITSMEGLFSTLPENGGFSNIYWNDVEII